MYVCVYVCECVYMLICTYVYGIAIPAPKIKSHNNLGHYKSIQIVFLT